MPKQIPAVVTDAARAAFEDSDELSFLFGDLPENPRNGSVHAIVLGALTSAALQVYFHCHAEDSAPKPAGMTPQQLAATRVAVTSLSFSAADQERFGRALEVVAPSKRGARFSEEEIAQARAEIEDLSAGLEEGQRVALNEALAVLAEPSA